LKWAWALVLMASGCSRCGAPPAPAVKRIHRSTDLRTAVFTAFPEFRGAQVVEGNAELVRTFDRPVMPEKEVLETVGKNGFQMALDAGALLATRAPFVLRLEGTQLAVSLPLRNSDIGKLLGAPTAMTTEQLALWFPKISGANLVGETFRVTLRYESADWRTAYLAWQMVDLNSHGSWRVAKWPEGYDRERRPDGGGGATPDVYSLELTDNTTQARIQVHRDRAFVDLTYLLQTEEAP
jgi:hypothetical protein